MDPESRKLLVDTYKLTKENNEMLLKIRRVQRWAQIYRFGYWIIIIGVSFGSYYFIQPYISSLLGYYGGISKEANNLGGNVSQLKDLLKTIQK